MLFGSYVCSKRMVDLEGKDNSEQPLVASIFYRKKVHTQATRTELLARGCYFYKDSHALIITQGDATKWILITKRKQL